MKEITLQYPDEVSLQTVLADMTENSRARSTHRPTVVFADADFPGLRQSLIQRRIKNDIPAEEP